MSDASPQEFIEAQRREIERLHHFMEYAFSIDAQKALLDLEDANKKLMIMRNQLRNAEDCMASKQKDLRACARAIGIAKNGLNYIAADANMRKSYVHVATDTIDSIDGLVGEFIDYVGE